MKVFLSLLCLLSLFAVNISLAQEENSASQNPIKKVIEFIDRISSSEEHLIHKARVGPYMVNADGQRLIGHPYLKFSITENGKAISPESTVTVDSTLYVHEQEPLKHVYTTVFDGKYFVIDPIDLQPLIDSTNGNGGWFEFDLTIDSDAGVGTKGFGLDYFPPRPETGVLFSLVSTLLPIVLLGIIVILFKFMRLRRNQTAFEGVVN